MKHPTVIRAVLASFWSPCHSFTSRVPASCVLDRSQRQSSFGTPAHDCYKSCSHRPYFHQTRLFSSQIDESFAIVDEPTGNVAATKAGSDSSPYTINDGEEESFSDDDAIYINDKFQPSAKVSTINGTSDVLFVTQMYHVPIEGFNIEKHVNVQQARNTTTSQPFTAEDVQRLEITSMNVTLPIALMLLDPDTYPTQSRARKAIRKKKICYSRFDSSTEKDSDDKSGLHFQLGKVITRIYPGDIIGYQRPAGDDYYSTQGEMYRPPPFDIPVIYEDDHMAIINKPAGIVLYRAQGGRGGGAKNGGHGRDTLLSALPHVLSPSNISDIRLIEEGHVPLKRPHPVHRLDRPTSGLVVVAKTKYAAIHLARQFEFRQARKSYMAIVNGYPTHEGSDEETNEWNTIDFDLEEKSSITEWRVVKTAQSLQARNGVITLVEMKPKTGRYHQLRRHFVSEFILSDLFFHNRFILNILACFRRGSAILLW